jgi:glycosyltransferase involved in cell wall biosynthesis
MQPPYPPVVVITPAYNGEPFLREALDSVQAQTYPKLVHCVLDNASTDATPAILANYGAQRVPLEYQRNDKLLPIAENWNRALQLARKDAAYFRILCADDTMPPDGIEKMVALAESDPSIGLVACQRLTDAGVETFNWDPSRRVFDGPEALRACFLGESGFAPPHFLYRSANVQRRATFFDESILSFDTEAGFYILSEAGMKLGFVHEPLGYTRRHEASVTEREVHAKHTDFFDWNVLLERYAHYVLTPSELHAYTQAFRRHYFGRMLAWRFADRNPLAFDWHMTELQSIDQVPTAADFADAILDYGLRKIGVRSRWDRYPQG